MRGAEPEREPVDLRVTGRNVEVPEHFRAKVAEKLERMERYDPSLHRFSVELTHERNRRQSKSCQRVEITGLGKGPVVRAEACAESFYGALEGAVTKLEARLRRASDQRKVHHGRHTPVSVAEASAAWTPQLEPTADEHEPEPEDGPGRVVRVKEHPATPMSVDEALYEMELVGHDFFLFHDLESDRPSVVYRRHAFDYGVIRLA
ncbi:MAG: ribosome-associated translation inhibitor RaiA [Mycobacteriaceae bacterium]